MFGAQPGRIVVKGGASGTVSVPADAILQYVLAHSTAGGTVAIGGATIPIIAAAAPTPIPFADDNYGKVGDIVFTTTDSYVVVYKLIGVQ